MQTVFTTGQIAKLCKVAPRTVSKWFDSGRLRGYRVPGSRDRRIPRACLIQFLREHGMPLGELEQVDSQVIAVTTDKMLLANLRLQLSQDKHNLRAATSSFTTGMLVAAFTPNVLIVDFLIGLEEANSVVTHSLATFPEVRVFAIHESVVSDAHKTFARPLQLDAIVADILAATVSNTR